MICGIKNYISQIDHADDSLAGLFQVTHNKTTHNWSPPRGR